MHFQVLLLAASLLASVPALVTGYAIAPYVSGSTVVDFPVSRSLVQREEETKPATHPAVAEGGKPAVAEPKKEGDAEGGMEGEMKNEGGAVEGEMKKEGGVAEAKKESEGAMKEGGMEGEAKKESGAEGKKEEGKKDGGAEGGMKEGEAKKEGGEVEKKEGIKKEGEAKKESGKMEGEVKKEEGGEGGVKKEGELPRIGNAPVLVGGGRVIAHQRPQYIVIILPELMELYALMAMYLGFQPSFGTSFFSGLATRPSFNSYYSIRASNNQTDSQLQTLQLINQISLANTTLSKASPLQVSAFVKDVASKNDVPVSLISSLASSVLDTMASNNVTSGSVYSTFAAVSKLANQTTVPTQAKNTTATSVAATTIPPNSRIGSSALAITAFSTFPVFASLLMLA
ncbi:UNVERIFIED_CONTAM: hypothetical protein HDU68_011809 [Siphonaria sp. JEL0065]|nr:hypothetical protein HDU68_011809 [Siphonaria sp. JEL0065]